jgi:hypothetical protein
MKMGREMEICGREEKRSVNVLYLCMMQCSQLLLSTPSSNTEIPFVEFLHSQSFPY